MTVELFSVSDNEDTDGYRSEAGHTMRREYCLTGKMIDFDQYRSDLTERNGFKIIC